MTQFWADGAPITVTVDADDLPEEIIWNEGRHEVQRVVNQWRIDTGWWRSSDEGGRVWRDYYLVITWTRLLVTIYRDLLSERWYLQRLYD